MTDIARKDLEALILYARLGSQDAVAEYLGVHKQTVKNRILDAKRAIGAVSTTQAVWVLLDGESSAEELLDGAR